MKLRLSAEVFIDKRVNARLVQFVHRNQSARGREGDFCIHGRVGRKVDIGGTDTHDVTESVDQTWFAFEANTVVLNKHGAVSVCPIPFHDVLLNRSGDWQRIDLTSRELLRVPGALSSGR